MSSQTLFRRALRLLLFPFWIALEVIVFLFDWLIGRYLIAAIAVGIPWVPGHWLFGFGWRWFFLPTLILGIMLVGVWEGCPVFAIRPLLARYGLVASRRHAG